MAYMRATPITGTTTVTGKTVWGWQFAENAGTAAAARVLLRDGGSSGTIVLDIRLAGGQSAGDSWQSTPLLLVNSTLYVEVNAGTVRGSVFVS